jgi:site-specific DNA-methyltransferase (adenine-specific)
LHPTQKSVELLRYLIRTYSSKGELVLDNTAGSMSTAIAAMREGRRFLMVEKDERYFEIGKKRIEGELKNPTLF